MTPDLKDGARQPLDGEHVFKDDALVVLLAADELFQEPDAREAADARPRSR